MFFYYLCSHTTLPEDHMKLSVPILFLLLLLLPACTLFTNKETPPCDMPCILESDTLRILTLNTSTSYFIYRDQPMGYHYDIIREFCRTHGLVPEVIVAPGTASLMRMLQEGVGDVIAYHMPVTREGRDSVIYCGLQQINHQVLVQRAMQGDTLVDDVAGLIGKRVTVTGGSRYYQRMVHLNEELGGGILIEHAGSDSIVPEDLIRMVSRGEIAYTVADDDLARLNQTYFRNLHTDLQISFDQRSSWVVRRDTPQLADSLDSWFERKREEPVFLRIMKRYFEETKGFYEEDRFSYSEILGPGVISPFDGFFRQEGVRLGIDWRLLAAIAYQESTFRTEESSWAGAVGLMGLMPATAASLGVTGDQLYEPEQNIRAGAQYLQQLISLFSSVEESSEQIKLALAAYNGGIGHISDARALAEKYEADKDIWEGNVERFVQLKRLEQYYSDPVCRNGYFRGDETINYVREVTARWEQYRQEVKE